MRTRGYQYGGMALGLLLLLIGAEQAAWEGSAALHTLMEAIATILAFTVGTIALIRYYSKKKNTFLFIGAGFLGTGFLDGYHTIVTSVWFAGIFPSAPPSLIPWSWITSQVFLSLALWLSIWLGKKEKVHIEARTVYGVAGVLGLVVFLFFAFTPLPVAYIPDFFFHRPAEFVPAIFFALAFAGYIRQGEWKASPFEHGLLMALGMSVVSLIFFMSRSHALFDPLFDLAHLVKILSYVSVLIGLLGSMLGLFRQAEESVITISQANAELQQEIALRQETEEELQQLTRTLEERVQQRTADLQRSNDELQVFAYVASHDLQEPLRMVSSYLQLLSRRYKDKLDQDAEEYIGFAVDGAQRMQQLIRDLLTYSRIETRKGPMDCADLQTIAEEVLHGMQVMIQERNADVLVAPLPTLPCDVSQIRQLLQNLISNAIKYNTQDQPVVRVSAAAMGKYWLCRVADNGIGIAPAHFERIFRIFQRLHGKGEYSGTGIGLAVCRRIVHRHQGTIWVESAPGAGSTFFFTLPAAPP